MSIDYGQAKISALNEAARAGVFRFDPAAVQEIVGLYEQMISQLHKIRDKLGTAKDAKGFGGFESAKQLQRGFSNKATEGIAVMNQLIEGAMRLQEAYLRAGDRTVEADRINARAISFAAQNSGLDDTHT
ncbi:hypothetical protein [Nocardia sp. NPDC052566]|uniref:hypothetical protein n=1 Tax=Nocardia sp. NPDC052566 TaxID=3364330 RepID=UPI0037CB9273